MLSNRGCRIDFSRPKNVRFFPSFFEVVMKVELLDLVLAINHLVVQINYVETVGDKWRKFTRIIAEKRKNDINLIETDSHSR